MKIIKVKKGDGVNGSLKEKMRSQLKDVLGDLEIVLKNVDHLKPQPGDTPVQLERDKTSYRGDLNEVKQLILKSYGKLFNFDLERLDK